MKRGEEIYFISKGVVRSGKIEDQDGNSVRILYTHGIYQKRYTFKKNEIAVEIEGGINVGNRLGVCSNGKGNKRCHQQNSKVRYDRNADKETESSSNNVPKGVWAI